MDFYVAQPRKEVQVANRLTMAMIQSILTLNSQGWSERRSARELRVNREAVSRYVRTAAAEAPGDSSKPANAPLLGSGESGVGNGTTESIGRASHSAFSMRSSRFWQHPCGSNSVAHCRGSFGNRPNHFPLWHFSGSFVRFRQTYPSRLDMIRPNSWEA